MYFITLFFLFLICLQKFDRSITQPTGLDDWHCLVTSYIEVKFQFKPEPHTSTCTLLLQQSPGICKVVHVLWYR